MIPPGRVPHTPAPFGAAFDSSSPGMGIKLDHQSAAEYRVDPGADEAVRAR